jgi:hypothetical protein
MRAFLSLLLFLLPLTANAEMKISQLTLSAGSAIGASDYLPFVSVSGGETRRVLISDLFTSSNSNLGTLSTSRLPNPTSSTLGGIRSYAAVSNEFINAISTSGVPSSARPACATLSNAAASCSTDTTSATNISSGTLAKARGGAGADMSSVTFPSSGTLAVTFSSSQVICDTPNGHGSTTGTKIRRWTTCTTTGTDITYADDANAGSTFTINTAGVYALSYTDYATAASVVFGFSNSSAQLTTNIQSITTANRLLLTVSQTNANSSVSTTVRCAASDVIRTHTNGAPNANGADAQFRIVRIN